jgi:hypothetical protein
MIDSAPVWMVALLVDAGVLIAAELGHFLGSKTKVTPATRVPDELVIASAFTLVALLLGFTFSMALGRFDARRTAIVSEANAVTTLALRTDLLDTRTGSALRADLRDYVSARLVVAANEAGERTIDQAAARSGNLQHTMWRRIMTASHRDPGSNTIPLAIQSINDMIDAGAQEGAVLSAYVPKSVLFMLIAISLASTVLMGFRFGRNGQRELIATITLALILALAIGIVLDLGAPQRGIIRVNLEPLYAAQHSIRP